MRSLWTFCLTLFLVFGLTRASFSADGDNGYFLKFKPHVDIGKAAMVEKKETVNSRSKLVGIEPKKVLEDNKEEQTTVSKYQETILEATKDGDPTRLRRDYERAQTTADGKPTDMPWQGKTILIEKKNGQFRFSIAGGDELTGPKAEPLAGEFGTAPSSLPSDLIPPDKATRVDESHEIDPKVLLKVFGGSVDAGIKLDAAKVRGSWKLTRVYKKEGRQFGVVELHADLPILEMTSTPQANPKAAEKLAMRPGAKMTLHTVIDGCIDGSAAAANSEVDMEINGTAMVPSADNPQFDLVLSIKTTTKVAAEESSAAKPSRAAPSENSNTKTVPISVIVLIDAETKGIAERERITQIETLAEEPAAKRELLDVKDGAEKPRNDRVGIYVVKEVRLTPDKGEPQRCRLPVAIEPGKTTLRDVKYVSKITAKSGDKRETWYEYEAVFDIAAPADADEGNRR